MKKIFTSFLFAGLVGISSAGAIEVGETFTDGDLTYIVKSENTVGLSDVVSSATAVTLNPTVSYEGVDYTLVSIERDAFYYSKITSIDVPSTVTSLEYGAFRSCYSLASITLHEGLKTIGDYAFYGTITPSITIPEGVESIGGSCFFTCSKLTDIKLPSTLKSIGASCFYKTSLASIDLPASLEVVGKSAFSTCTKLASINIPAGVKNISEGMFYGCTALTSIDLPESIETIGDEAFQSSGLTGAFTLPASVTELGGGIFAKTTVSEINLASGSSLQKVGECIYSADKSVLLAYPAKAANTVVSVDKACRGIGYGAFWGTNVTKVTIPDGLRAFNSYAFVLSSLAEINFPESVVMIGEQAFAGTSLTDVVLPANLPELQDAAFAQATSLKSVTLPSSLNYMDIRVFTGCTALTTVNAYGTTPATLEDVYESYEGQFYNISSSATLNLRPGCTAAYKSAGWNSYFNTVSESLPAIVVPSAISPEADSSVSTFSGVELTCDETVTIVKSTPDIQLIQGSLTLGTPVGSAAKVTGWKAIVNNSTTVKIFPMDDDGYTESVNFDLGTDWYLTIPAGVFKNAAGELNDRIFIHYSGSYEEPVFAPTAISPESESAQDQICLFELTFAEKATKVGSTYSKTKIMQDDPVSGKELKSHYDEWYCNGSGTTKISLFTADYDGYTCPLSLSDGVDYYVVIPAQAFRNSSWVYNKEIVLHYVKSLTDGIETVETAGADIDVTVAGNAININADSADVYTVAGVLVAHVEGEATVSNLNKGVYVVKARRGSDFKNVKLAL